MRKILALILCAIVSLFSLVGCGNKKDDNTSSTPKNNTESNSSQGNSSTESGNESDSGSGNSAPDLPFGDEPIVLPDVVWDDE